MLLLSVFGTFVAGDLPIWVFTQSDTGAVGVWTSEKAYSGLYSAHLDTGSSGAGNEARLTILLAPSGGTVQGGIPLGDIETLSWYIYAVAGYPAHVDITMDVDGDGVIDIEDMLTAELAVNNPGYGSLGKPPYGTYDQWLRTFELASGDGYGVIDNSTIFWVTKMGAGNLDAPSSTLAHWKEGIVDSDPQSEMGSSIPDANTPVIGLEIEIDRWIVDSEAYLDDVELNGVNILDFIGPQGSKGETGDTGATGIQGTRGTRGYTGTEGSQGDQGELGPQGPPGESITGLEGETGETGSQGIQGVLGPRGIPGEQGDIGLTGTQGEIGEQGPRGQAGEKGSTGLTGLQGETATATTIYVAYGGVALGAISLIWLFVKKP